MMRSFRPSLLGWREQLDRDQMVVFLLGAFFLFGSLSAIESHNLLSLSWSRAAVFGAAVGAMAGWLGVRWGVVPLGILAVILRLGTWYP